MSCRIPNTIVQSKRWAARSIVLAGPSPGLALRCGRISGMLDPCSSDNSRERFAFCMCSSVAGRGLDWTHSASTFGRGKAFKAGSLGTTHRQDQATINQSGRAPRSLPFERHLSGLRAARLEAGIFLERHAAACGNRDDTEMRRRHELAAGLVARPRAGALAATRDCRRGQIS